MKLAAFISKSFSLIRLSCERETVYLPPPPSPLFLPLHILSLFFAVPVHSTITDIHAFLSLSCSFLSVAGLSLSYVYNYCTPMVQSRSVRVRCQKCIIFIIIIIIIIIMLARKTVHRTDTSVRSSWRKCYVGLQVFIALKSYIEVFCVITS